MNVAHIPATICTGLFLQIIIIIRSMKENDIMGIFDKFRKLKEESTSTSAYDHIVPMPTAIPDQQEVPMVLGFALLSSETCDWSSFIDNLHKDAEITIENQPNEENIVFEVEGMQVVVAHMPAPIPNREVEECCKYNLLWPEAEQVVATHRSHVIVSVSGAPNPIAGHLLFTQVVSSMMQLNEALAFHMAPMVVSAESYVESAQMLKEGELPVQLWVFIGLYQNEQGRCSYTRGLERFGKYEIEVIHSEHSLSEVFEFTMMVVDYVISYNVSLEQGETIGFSEEQRLSLTVSQGIAVENDSIKVGY